MSHPRRSSKEPLLVCLAGVLLLLLYHTTFRGYFPNHQGKLGHDYALFLPKLLDGSWWYQGNGLLAVPWFTPAFCGGIPLFPDPQSLYYSLPQFLSFWFDPLQSVYLTFLVFGGLGFLGTYVLLHGVFGCSLPVALFGAGCFLWNGFYAHRMLIGHLTYHAFMLVPLIAYVLLRAPRGDARATRWTGTGDVVFAGVLVAYMFQAGMVNVICPALGSIVGLACLHSVQTGQPSPFWRRFSLAGVVAGGLCCAKLVAAMAYLHHFGRDAYMLPGAPHLLDVVRLIGYSLFIGPAHVYAGQVLVHLQWLLDRHEFEFGVTVVPGLLLLFGSGEALWRRTWMQKCTRLGPWAWLHIAILAILLCLPVALNYYTPGWNAVLKQIPIVQNSTSLMRWISLYIPLVVVLSCLALEHTTCLRPYRASIAGVCLLTLVTIHMGTERAYYHAQSYAPELVVQAAHRTQGGEWTPAISHIAVFHNDAGQPFMPPARNDVLTQGHSQLLCYEPMFGYRLEAFPITALRPGPVMQEHNGFLNVKQPACYVYPAANACTPGDHFSVQQAQEAAAFVRYRPWPFSLPVWQRLANCVSGLTLAALGILLPTAWFMGYRTSRWS